MFTRALPEVSNLRKLYASKEATGRIKVLVLNESLMPTELSGKKINTPRRSLFDHKQKGKDKLQEEIDAFEEAPKALVKWVPKTTSSSTSSSATTTQGFPSRWCGFRRRRTREFLRVTPPTFFTHIIMARTSAINFHILH